MVTGLSGVINKNPTDLFCSYWYRLSLGNLWNGTSFLHRKSWNNEPSHQNFSKRIYILVESPISRYFRSSCKLLVLGSSVAACRSLKLQSYPQKSTHHPCKRNPHHLCHLHWVNHSWIPSSIEGDMGVYGIAVSGFFSCGISVILIFTCGIAVSSSSAVCGFSSFWLTVFGEIRLFTVLRYRLFALSFRYNALWVLLNRVTQ